MRAAAFLAALALVAASANAQDPSPEQGRIWKGTLGDTPITACFVLPETGNSAYYRDALLEPVRLEMRDTAAPTILTEATGADDPTGAIWTMQPQGETAMTGEWRKGAEVLPIRLTATPVDVPDYASACKAEAFIEPLLAGGTYTRKSASLDGESYTEIAYAGPKRAGLDDYHVVSFALDPVWPGDAAINAMLAAALPDCTAAHLMGQCAMSFLPNAGVPGYIDEAQVPILITRRWLALRYSGSSYCGGAHPYNFNNLVVYDRQSGARVDPAAWFTPRALIFYDWEPEPGGIRPIKRLSDALTDAVIARWPKGARDPECLEAARDGLGFGWQIGLTRKGPVFVPQFPHVLFACTEEVTLPWKAARRFLSPEGRAIAARLR